MKKFLLWGFLAFAFLSPLPVFASTNPMQNLSGNGARDVPTSYQIIADYDVREDGQPVYLGYSLIGKATSEDAWMIYYFTYDAHNQMLTKTTAYGVWDDHASLTYQ